MKSPIIDKAIDQAEKPELDEGNVKVVQVLKQMKRLRRKAVRPDEIQVEAWKGLGRTGIEWLAPVFRKTREMEWMLNK